MNRIFAVLSSVVAMTALFVITPTAAHAQSAQSAGAATGGTQTGLEEIVVTAQRREERAVDVPITITLAQPRSN